MTKTTMTASLLALALLAVPTLGGAQSVPGASSRAPIMWGADLLEVEGNTLTLVGNAELLQGQNRLRADRIAGLNQTGDSRLEAAGNVYFVTPEQTIRGDRAVYTTGNDTIVVTGDVILTQGQNVLTGSRLTYNTRTGSARVEGAPTAAGNRVQGVFYPEGND
jgi:lipopolysaccharide export system protein LptA